MKIESLFPVLVCCAAILAGMVCFDRCGCNPEEYTADTVTSVRCDTVHDTIYIPQPVAVESRRLDVMAVKFPRWRQPIDAADTSARAESGDSVTVAVAIEQRHYGGDDYDAWVSGYRPQLDSLRIYRSTATITRTQEITRWRTRRWGLSAGAGVSLSHHGVAPAVFVGVSYTFLAF